MRDPKWTIKVFGLYLVYNNKKKKSPKIFDQKVVFKKEQVFKKKFILFEVK